MRKFFFILFTIVALGLSILEAKADVGLKLGANYSTIGFDNTEGNKFFWGASGGLNFEIAAPKIFAFDIDVLYHLRSNKADVFNFHEDDPMIEEGRVAVFRDFKSNFHYLEVPATFKFYIFDWFNVGAGPYVSFLIAAKGEGINTVGVKETWNFISDRENSDLNGEDFLNRLDFGIHFDVEFVTKTGFGLGARYSQGFGDVTNGSFKPEWNNLNPVDRSNVKNSSAQAFLFYRF